MTSVIETKLNELPQQPGVYFYKDSSGEIIYVGKAANLRNRVRQYFQKSRTRDAKTDALVKDIADIEWAVVDTEIDALFLEAEQIRRNMPKYNILLRDDKSTIFIRISLKSDHPTVTTTRRPLDDGAEYFGPYLSAFAIKRALKYLRKAFPYSTHRNTQTGRLCLQYHLGLCPGLEDNRTTLEDYRKNLNMLIQYLKGNRVQLIRELEIDMKRAAKEKRFEEAAQYRNQLRALNELRRQVVFSDRENQDLTKDQGLFELATLLGLDKIPRRIEGYDISHMQGTDTVASMVVFSNGVPEKQAYRKFKMRIPGNDDFAHMNEVMKRRLARQQQKGWGLPDLILIDGGKGQLSSALAACTEHDVHIPIIGLAKRYEEIVVGVASNVNLSSQFTKQKGAIIGQSDDFVTVDLPNNLPLVKLLQRIRDESHRFAVSYHSVLKVKRQTASSLDEVPGIGPATKKKLLRHFGSLRAVAGADKESLEKVVGPQKASILRQYISKS